MGLGCSDMREFFWILLMGGMATAMASAGGAELPKDGYLIDTEGGFVRAIDGAGSRTSQWTPARAKSQCEAGMSPEGYKPPKPLTMEEKVGLSDLIFVGEVTRVYFRDLSLNELKTDPENPLYFGTRI